MNLSDKIYIEQPEGFAQAGVYDQTLYCKLQTPLWFKAIKEGMVQNFNAVVFEERICRVPRIIFFFVAMGLMVHNFLY